MPVTSEGIDQPSLLAPPGPGSFRGGVAGIDSPRSGVPWRIWDMPSRPGRQIGHGLLRCQVPSSPD